jgi:3-dehydroquinate dehydratase
VTDVLVLISRAAGTVSLPEGVMLVPFHTAFDAAIALRASDAPAVLVTDGLDSEDLDSLAGAIRERAGQCIEVRLSGWDGETHSPVSGACRGVISGFGADGVVRAVELLAKGQ